MINSTTLVSLKNVHKAFAGREIIKGIDLDVYPNEVVVLLGLNGAGKTTTINMMLGLEKPDHGTITLNGGDPCIPSNRLNLGVTPQNNDFPQHITVAETLAFVKTHYPDSLSVAEIVQQFDLTSIMDKQTGVLSGGQRRRLAVAMAFVSKPKIVFLDEPTSGLDVQSRLQVWKNISSYIELGGTLFLTTHYLEEAEALATRIVILQNGKIRIHGSVDEIKSLVNYTTVKFECESTLPSLINAIDSSVSHHHFAITTQNSDKLIYELVEKKVPFKNLFVEHGTLENAFLMLSNEAKQ